MNTLVHTERVDNVLVIDVASLNALLQGLQALEADVSVQAAVLHADGKVFALGSDVIAALPQAISAVESSTKPVVAALQGSVQGGHWEFVLACDARVASATTRMALPAVSQGLIPGAGTAQRLLRGVGALKALDLIGMGAQLTASQAQTLDLLDVVAQASVLDAAVNLAKSLQGSKRRMRDGAVAAVDDALLQTAIKDVLRKGKQRPATQAAVASIKNSIVLPFDDAAVKDQQALTQLREGRDAKALQYQLQAEQCTTVLPAELNVAPRAMQRIAVIGAGTMGTGIAISALDAGLQVQIFEQDQAALNRGVQRVQDFYDQRVAVGKLTQDKAIARKAALTSTLNWAELAQADVVIEAVFEDLAVKQNVFKTIDQHARAGALLATNTSYLDLDDIAQATSRPQDVIGLHFFSPANVMKLLEVVRLQGTAIDAIATGMALGKKLGKLPVLCGNAFGFIGNRIYNAYRKQVEFMLEDGALPEQVDAALQKFGFAMGPFAVADLSGLDIAWRMRKSQAATRNPKERYVSILDQLCEQGRLGRKTGSGYYTYVDGKKSAAVDDSVKAVIEQATQARGLTRRSLTDVEIMRRTLMAMCNEAALLLAEGVARQPSDIDVVLVQGYGFPRWEGGPLFWLSQFSVQEQAQMQTELAQHVGHGFAKGDLALLKLP
ncbi:enoyl-CoA hydratase/isomerase family protein [Comamonas sp. Y33R10-2]|uniref:3-hydroxyacyl-CoA dehydrogenase NAD-binding domain-containing protein n=1 Tax=Comamonas sp. Y33R10-2 TaxID=2853257 RepID=UPI001C5CAE89|nr:3-hydroxyacyl-CoA dehydrogenase NAD-binding domain-containing protein [Comamonas sp. Y33R10-2]QXZ10690.1 enoyl-CoA hydratase/isomerase family protein [Comamonas sp. Y33R10-2]